MYGAVRAHKQAYCCPRSEQAAAATREPLGATPSTGEAVKPRCVVVYESDPQPGAFMGRMSFQSFNREQLARHPRHQTLPRQRLHP